MGKSTSKEPKLKEVNDPLTCLLNLGFSHIISQCLYIAAKLDIATIVGKAERALTAIEIAKEHGGTIDVDLLQRILRLLSSKGIFTEVRVDVNLNVKPAFEVNSMSQFLRTDVPNHPSFRFLMINVVEQPTWLSWAHLESCVMSAESKVAFNEEHGMSTFEYYSKHPESADAFNNAMTNYSQRFMDVMLAAYGGRWTALERREATVIDIGGGHGLIMKTVKQHYPKLNCKVVELAEVVQSAPDKNCGVEFIVGDFFRPETLPKADVIFMRAILHDWNDDDCSKILKSCHLALNEGGRLIVAETVLPGAGVTANTDMKGVDMFLLDIHMMAIVGGRERSADEWAMLFEANQFRINDIIKTPANYKLMETYKL